MISPQMPVVRMLKARSTDPPALKSRTKLNSDLAAYAKGDPFLKKLSDFPSCPLPVAKSTPLQHLTCQSQIFPPEEADVLMPPLRLPGLVSASPLLTILYYRGMQRMLIHIYHVGFLQFAPTQENPNTATTIQSTPHHRSSSPRVVVLLLLPATTASIPFT